MVIVDTKYVYIPSDNWSTRRIYMHGLYNKYSIDVYPCIAQFPYGYTVVLANPDNGIGYIEIGPIPKGIGGKYYQMLIGDVSCGRGYIVSIETLNPVEKEVKSVNVAI
jgi:hypothetical protein